MNTDYELIDFGNGSKLERFGTVILDRPEVQAVGSSSLRKVRWQELASAKCVETTKSKGKWIQIGEVPESWEFSFENGNQSWKTILGLSPFKHIGLFPEQAEHWKYLMEKVKKGDRVLNLFGYTGAASLSAAAEVRCSECNAIVRDNLVPLHPIVDGSLHRFGCTHPRAKRKVKSTLQLPKIGLHFFYRKRGNEIKY